MLEFINLIGSTIRTIAEVIGDMCMCCVICGYKNCDCLPIDEDTAINEEQKE